MLVVVTPVEVGLVAAVVAAAVLAVVAAHLAGVDVEGTPRVPADRPVPGKTNNP